MDYRWQTRFLRLAHEVACWSKDPSTKVGCVLVNDLRQVVGLGYNGFPRGVQDHQAHLVDRDTKYRMTVHAEVNAVLQATASTRGATAFVTHPPCSNCTGVLIQAGVKAVYSPVPEPGLAERFAESFESAKTMAGDAGVSLNYIPDFGDCATDSETVRLRREVEALEQLRPVWAQGYTSDSLAAQASANALSDLWHMLGAGNQTEAVARLRDMLEFEDG